MTVIVVLLLNALMMVLVGTGFTVWGISDNRKDPRMKDYCNSLDGEQAGITTFMSFLWPIGLIIVSIHFLSSCFLREKKEIKCLLCATKNTSDSSHCKHCGNLLTSKQI